MSTFDGYAIVPPANGEPFVELSRSKTGRVFEKHILNYGDLIYPGAGTIKIDDDFADTLIANFTNKVCDIVQVPKAGPKNEHTEDPDRNIGEVIGLTKRDGKVYAQIDARIEADADKLGKTLLGASAMMHLNYPDTHTGKPMGPTLLHVAVTNRPFITKLEEFSELNELVAASADGSSDAVILTAPTTKEFNMPTKEELIAALSADHGIDVVALQAKASEADKAIALSHKIEEQLGTSGLIKLSNGETASADDLIGAVADAGSKIVALSNTVETLVEDGKKKDATARVERLVATGHILPKNKEDNVTLLLSQPELFERLLPEKPVVELSNSAAEFGFEPTDETHAKTVEDEILRLSNSDAAKPYTKVPASA
jgi:hypothetical protein